MDFNAIIDALMSAVSTVGFPIVCCGVLFYQNSKLTETISDLKSTLVENTTLLKTIANKFKED